MVKTFDPKQISLIFAGKIISGFADGSFLTAERDDDLWTLKNGVDGEATRTKSNNFAGKIKFSLMQTAQSNDDLSNIALLDEVSNSGLAALLLKDGSGRTLCTAVTAWIPKQVKAEFSKDPAIREWTIQTDNLAMFVGGN